VDPSHDSNSKTEDEEESKGKLMFKRTVNLREYHIHMYNIVV